MRLDPITVVIEQPWDWMGSLVVPVAAILVSTWIAFRISQAERRAAERSEQKRAIANLMGALRRLSDAAVDGDRPAVNAAGRSAYIEIDTAALLHGEADQPFFKYVAAVLHLAGKNGTMNAINTVCRGLVVALEAWASGKVPTADFSRAMPPIADTIWSDTVDPTNWSKWLDGVEEF